VQRAVNEWTYRSNQIEELTQQEITQGTIMVDVSGATVGQVNGLSVSTLGDYSFGGSRASPRALHGPRGRRGH
jgi:predicted ATP-dependent protease